MNRSVILIYGSVVLIITVGSFSVKSPNFQTDPTWSISDWTEKNPKNTPMCSIHVHTFPDDDHYFKKDPQNLFK